MLPNKKKYYPATERQKASWKEYIENGKKLYLHIGNVLDLHKPDPHSIKKTVNALVIRHESLRTTFETNEEGTAVQVVHDSESFKIEIEREDCSAEPSPLQKAESIMREMTNELWDLEKGPLVRLKLVHLGEGEARLIIAIQHIISDADSMKVFAREFMFGYNSFINQKPIRAEPLAFQLKDFAHWEQNYLNGGTGKKNLDYWRKEVNGSIKEFQVQYCYQRGDSSDHASQTGNGAEYVSYLPLPLLNDLKSLAVKLRTSKLCVFCAGLTSLLYHLSKLDELLIAVPISLRNRKELMNLIGYMNTDIYLRMKVGEYISFEELISVVSDKYFTALDHRHYQMDQISDRGNRYRAAILNELPASNENLKDFGSQLITKDNGRMALSPFYVMITEYKNGLKIHTVYDNSLLDAKRVPVICDGFVNLLKDMTKTPYEKVSNVIDKAFS
ncbi:MAG: condensation domain-containing protein [Bacteroidota bacterium]